MAAFWKVTCDAEGCLASHITGCATWNDVQARAAELKWKLDAPDEPMFCFDHRPDKYSPCVVCGRPRRRRGWKKQDHPGTMAWGTKGRCVSCASAEKLGAGAEVRLDRAVEKYLMFRGPEYAYVFHGTEWRESNTDLARKAAPEDLWQTLGI